MKRAQVRPLILRGPRFPSNPSNLPPRRGVERSPFTVHPPAAVLRPRPPVILFRSDAAAPARLVLRAVLRAVLRTRSGARLGPPRARKPALRLVYSGASSSMRVCRGSVGRLSTRMRATRNAAYSTLAGCREIRHNARCSPTTEPSPRAEYEPVATAMGEPFGGVLGRSVLARNLPARSKVRY